MKNLLNKKQAIELIGNENLIFLEEKLQKLENYLSKNYSAENENYQVWISRFNENNQTPYYDVSIFDKKNWETIFEIQNASKEDFNKFKNAMKQ